MDIGLWLSIPYYSRTPWFFLDGSKMLGQACGDSQFKQLLPSFGRLGLDMVSFFLPNSCHSYYSVLMSCVTASDVRLWFHMLLSATGSSHLKGAWKSGMRGTNICCVHSAVCVSVLLLQKQLTSINIVPTSHKAFLYLKHEYRTIHQDTAVWEPCVRGLAVWPC